MELSCDSQLSYGPTDGRTRGRAVVMRYEFIRCYCSNSHTHTILK